MNERSFQLTIPMGLTGRLDRALTKLVPDEFALSRSRIQDLIAKGAVLLEGEERVFDAARGVREGQNYHITIPPLEPSDIAGEDIPLDIIFEDEDLLVVNKRAGMVVHPGRGVSSGTLVNALVHHCGDRLSGVGGVERPGLVHRIDKDTSGLLVVAKSDFAHEGLGKQFRAHSITRRYTAYCYGLLKISDARLAGVSGVSRESGVFVVDAPIGRHKTDRLKMAIREGGKEAQSTLLPLAHDEAGIISKVEARLATGRTHQIRVHMTHIGFPLLGDPLYGAGSRQLPKFAPEALPGLIGALPGQALHAGVLGFLHPKSGEALEFEVPLPAPLQAIDDYVSGDGIYRSTP